MSEEKVLTLRGKKAVWAPGGGSGPIDPKRLPEGYPYKEMAEVVVLEETVTTSSDNAYANFSSYVDIEGGKAYKVRINGVEYECEGMLDGNAYVEFGVLTDTNNLDVWDVFYIRADGQSFKINLKTAGTYAVSISTQQEVVHTMDPTLLPENNSENAGSVFIVSLSAGSEPDTYVADKTTTEINAAVEAGQVVVLHYNHYIYHLNGWSGMELLFTCFAYANQVSWVKLSAETETATIGTVQLS